MKNRQKDEILRDILTVCNGSRTSITKIMFHAGITHGQAKSYLEHLIDNSLLNYNTLDRQYRVTPKGMEYLKAVDTMVELFPVATKRAAREQLVDSF